MLKTPTKILYKNLLIKTSNLFLQFFFLQSNQKRLLQLILVKFISKSINQFIFFLFFILKKYYLNNQLLL